MGRDADEEGRMTDTCALCGRRIAEYDPRFHRLPIDETRAADICSSCIDAVMRMQRQKLAELFPTKAAKRYARQQECAQHR
jgi:hypothetical protein